MKREYNITIELDTGSQLEAKKQIKKAFKNVVSIKCLEKRRTSQQNKSLHLYFTMLAVALNDAGFDMKKTFKQDIDIPWNSYNVKEFLWRNLQKSITGKKSTAQLSRQDIDRVYEVLNKTIGERTGVFVEWPSIEGIMRQESY